MGSVRGRPATAAGEDQRDRVAGGEAVGHRCRGPFHRDIETEKMPASFDCQPWLTNDVVCSIISALLLPLNLSFVRAV